MSDTLINENKDLEFAEKERDYFLSKRLPEKKFNPKNNKTSIDRLMDWVIFG